MNREIKFRAWDKSMKKMIYPKLWDNSMPSNWGHWYELQQFTGLKDANGKEIYEGDIIQWVSSNPFSIGEVRIVQVNYVQAQFWCYGTIGVYLAELLANEKCQIIGNLYETPELLK